jgi:GT2 family glycosyltransferase
MFYNYKNKIMDSPTICAVLNIFNRVEYLEKQILSLLDQEQPISEYIIRVNNTEKRNEYIQIINRLVPQAIVFESNTNL